MVRHGETEWNERRIIQGHTNSSLTPTGREQARALGETLRELGFDHIVTSDLERAQETALIVGEVLGLRAETDPLLRERGYGEYEGRPSEELSSNITGVKEGVMVNPDARPLGGESFRDVVARARRFLQRADEEWPETRLLVVTHGGMVQALRAATSARPLEGTLWFRVGNCTSWTL
ncbi:MAG: histidine phosphatase [Acidimicrobiaceae bacterium]|nr:histidine phosphatase [Acidimicrobiaceae bacterium]